MDNEIKAVLQALAKEDVTVKEVAQAGFTYMEGLLQSGKAKSVNNAADQLAVIAVKAGYQRNTKTWNKYYKTTNWLVAETGGFNWLEGVALDRHFKAADKMTWDEFVANPPAARLAGKIGESWLTTIRRAITEAKTGTRHAEVDSSGRSTSAKRIREALPSFDEGIEQLQHGLSVLEGA